MKKICLVGRDGNRDSYLMEDERGLILLSVRRTTKVSRWSIDRDKRRIYNQVDSLPVKWFACIREAIEKRADGRSKKRLLKMLEAAIIYREL